MKKQRITAFILTGILTLMWCVTGFAASFPDVDATKYSWAYEAIDEMSNEGIIKGYEDKTFGPERTVTKLEALVLVARILGVNNKENATLVENAVYSYETVINEYDLPYGETEIAFLLAKNVITEDELDTYIDESTRDDGLKRYEVAIILTKAMDGESQITNALTVLDYEDASDIPSYARKYVQFVTEKGLMQGMEVGKFVPNSNVTRAQAAVVLYKLKNITNYEYQSGVVASVDTSSKIIKIKDENGDTYANTVSNNVILRIDGKVSQLKEVTVGMNALITFKDSSVYAVDFTHPLVDDVIQGSYVGHTTSTKAGNTISIYVIDDEDIDVTNDKKETFKIAEDFVITMNGATGTLASIKAGNFVALTVKAGKVTKIDVQEKTRTVSGKITKVEAVPNFKITIENNDGDEETYFVASDVVINKNGSQAEGNALLEGDSVTLTLTYDRITKVVAKSKTSTKSGVISEIVISNNPKITITTSGEDIRYPMSVDAEIIVNGSDATIYDLRNGVAAELTIESDTIQKITTTATSGTSTQLTGKIESVNTKLSLIQISYTDPTLGTTRVDPIYLSDATIFDNTSSKTKKISDLKVGSNVTVIGSVNTGVFVATTVVMID